MKEQVSSCYHTFQHWKQETKGIINIFKTWKDGKNFEPEMFGLSWSEEDVLKVDVLKVYFLRNVFTSFVCLELGEKCKPEWVWQQKVCTHSPWYLSLCGGATSTTLSVSSPWLGANTQCIHQHNSRGRTPRFMAERGARWFQRVESALCGRKPNSTNGSDTDVLVSV